MAGANRSMGPPGAYQNHLQMNVHQNQPQTQTHPLHNPPQTHNPSLVSYQGPNQANISQTASMPQQPQRSASLATPQYTGLAHPADLLSNISLSVASLETFQLQEILSIAALRHPDILDLLRTCFNQKETNRNTAHQALYDRLLTQSQEQARIIRTENERVRNNPIHAVGPFGPPQGAAPHPIAPAQGHVPQYGLATPHRPLRARGYIFDGFRLLQDLSLKGQSSALHQLDNNTSAPNAQSQKSCAQASTNLPAEVTSYHNEINHLLNPKEPNLTPKAKFDTLRFLCYLAIKTVPQALWTGLDTLEKLRDDCCDGYEQFLSAFRGNSIYEPKVRVQGSDDERARRKIGAEEPSMVRDSDEDSIDSEPGQSDSLADIGEYDDNDNEDEGESD
ncbi:hypothetical protein E4T42_01291 [Aureobasidium subglaciale]|nr:hypothetical protein E4T42_01291 [Aureobasidium subglaciale]